MRTVVGGPGGAAADFAIGQADVAAQASAQEINHELKKAYDDARQQSLVDSLTGLVETHESNEVALNEFQAKLAELLGLEPADAPVDPKQPDYAEATIGELSSARWRELLEILGDEDMRLDGAGGGGTSGLGDPFKKLWAGAKGAIATYWQMKQRADIDGHNGLGQMVVSQFTPCIAGSRSPSRSLVRGEARFLIPNCSFD
jgi:hypothetical protein